MNGNPSKIIIVVDDDRRRREFFESILAGLFRPSGYTLMHAQNADVALHFIDSGHRPDGMVINVEMPGMSGIELVKELKKREIAVAVILTLDGIDGRFGWDELALFSTNIITSPISYREFKEMASKVFGTGEPIPCAIPSWT